MRIRMLPLPSRPRAEEVLLSATRSTPVLVGSGSVDFECWRCRFPVCHGLTTVFDAADRVYRCPSCDALNRSPL